MKKAVATLFIYSLCSGAALNDNIEENNPTLLGDSYKLLFAVKYNEFDTIESMLNNKADINQLIRYPFAAGYSGFHTVLHQAIIGSNYEMVKFLLENGANPNAEAKVERPQMLRPTALDFAFANKAFFLNLFSNTPTTDNNNKIIQILLEYGAKVNDNIEFESNFPMVDFAKSCARIFSKSAVYLGLKRAPQHIAKNLTQAILLNNQDEVKFYLSTSTGKEINQRDNYNFTPLMYVCSRGNLNLLKIILNHCSQKNLNLELSNEYLDVSKLNKLSANLVQNGGQVFTPLFKPTPGETAMELAKKHGHQELIEYLKNFLIDLMHRSTSEKLPRPILNLICQYSKL